MINRTHLEMRTPRPNPLDIRRFVSRPALHRLSLGGEEKVQSSRLVGAPRLAWPPARTLERGVQSVCPKVPGSLATRFPELRC